MTIGHVNWKLFTPIWSKCNLCNESTTNRGVLVSMNGKSYRLNRIFRPDTGNTVILPVDHSISLGAVPGLEDPIGVLTHLSHAGVDGILLNDGLNTHADAVFTGRNTPARIVNADCFYEDGQGITHGQINWPELAVRKGYDAIKVLLLWDQPAASRMENVKMLAAMVREAEKWELPVMIEPTTVHPVSDLQTKIALLSDATRVAYELGADILKVSHPGNSATLTTWCNQYKVPLILLGGGLAGDTEQVISLVSEAINIGVRGVAIGRNVWQRPKEESERVLRAFVNVIHRENRP